MLEMLKKIFRYKYTLLILIVIIASFLRLYQISELPLGLYPDEAMNGNNALEALSSQGSFKIFYPENNGREGLFINIQALSVAIFGNVPWALRLISALFGIFTVLGVYFLTKILFEKNAGYDPENHDPNPSNPDVAQISVMDFGISRGHLIALLSSLFVATSFWHINFSRIGFRAIMSTFFLTWALYFLIKFLNETAPSDQPAPTSFKTKLEFYKNAIICGIFYGLGFHSYIAYRATPLLILIIILFYWFRNKDKQIRKRILTYSAYGAIATVIMALPLIIYFAANPQDFFGRTNQISVFNSASPIKDLTVNTFKTLGMFNFEGDSNWRHNYSGRAELFWPVGIMLIVGFIAGLARLLKRHPKRRTFEQPAQISKSPDPDLVAAKMLAANQGLKQEQIQALYDPFAALGTQTENQTNPPMPENTQPKNEPEAPKPEDEPPFINKLPFVVLFSWLIIASLPIVISNEGIPHALRAIIMIPPIFILSGFGGIWIYERYFSNTSKQIKIKNIVTAVFLVFIITESYYTYFINWGTNPNVLGAFNQDYVDIGEELNSLPQETPKYIIVNGNGALVRGIPMPAQTVMFITDTFTPEKQDVKNTHYILPDQINQIPEGAFRVILE